MATTFTRATAKPPNTRKLLFVSEYRKDFNGAAAYARAYGSRNPAACAAHAARLVGPSLLALVPIASRQVANKPANTARRRSGRVYQPGIGPHPEDRAVDLTVGEISAMRPEWRIALLQIANFFIV